jgi:hypothetical protein
LALYHPSQLFRKSIAVLIVLVVVFGVTNFACTYFLYARSGTTDATVLIQSPVNPASSNSIWQNMTRIYRIPEISQQLGISTVLAKVITISSLPNNNIVLNVTSPYYIHDVAGKFVKIRGIVTNLNSYNSTSGGLAYISIVDIKEKIPVDLEDWSVEKGLYIPSLNPGQSLPLEWDVRLVKAGSYTVDILFNTNGNLVTPPVVSSKISLIVDPKSNLNPGNVLPVTFGVPAVLMATLGSINYLRAKKTRI